MKTINMATIVLINIFFFIPNALALSFQVIGAQGKLMYQIEIPVKSEKLGEFSHRALQQALQENILNEYNGSEMGVLSINNMGSSLEVLSDTQMNAYGWCYKIDGITPNILTNDYILSEKESAILWYYAYAKFETDTWTDTCLPAEHIPPPELYKIK